MVVTETPAYEQAINYCKKNIRSVASIFFRLDFILRDLARRNLMKKGDNALTFVAIPRPVAPAVETVAVEVIEQPAPGVITVTEVEVTPGSGLRRALKRMNPNRQSSRGSTPGD